MSFENRPKAPTTQTERDAMAVRLLESADFVDDELGKSLLKLIREGFVYVYPDGNIEITEEGVAVVDESYDNA